MQVQKNTFITEIDNFEKKNLAKNRFEIDIPNGLILNGSMDVWGNLDRGKGFGIVMHLNNVMELFENNLERIQLESLGQAVFFHSLCKFEPDLQEYIELILKKKLDKQEKEESLRTKTSLMIYLKNLI